MTLGRIVAGGAALALLTLPGGPGFSFAAGSSVEADLAAVAACDQDAKPAHLTHTGLATKDDVEKDIKELL